MQLKQILLIGALALTSCEPYAPVVNNITEIVTPIDQEKPTRDDFDINLTLGEYKVGDYLNFSGQMKNKSSSNIDIDNSDRKSLEYKLLKDNEVLFSDKGTVCKLTIYPNGFFDSIYKDNKLKTKLLGVKFEDAKNKLDIPVDCPMAFSISVPYTSFVLNEAGVYTLQANLIYSIEGSNYSLTFSKDLEVKK